MTPTMVMPDTQLALRVEGEELLTLAPDGEVVQRDSVHDVETMKVAEFGGEWTIVITKKKKEF